MPRGYMGFRSFFRDIIVRPDDMVEVLCYWKRAYGARSARYPNAVVKAFAEVLSGLSEYQVAKYKLAKRDMKLVDLVRICHPKHTPQLRELVYGTLEPPVTWEVEVSQKGADKGAVWSRLVTEERLGYMALIRNLRNIEQHCSDSVLDVALSQLKDPERVRASRLLPFRFITAMEQGLCSKTQTALSVACEHALDNCPEFDGNTCVILDVSGSMSWCTSGINPGKVGSLFGAILAKKNMADLVVFGNNGTYAQCNLADSVLTVADQFNQNRGVGHGTCMTSAINTLNKKYDRLIVLSDMQTWCDQTLSQVAVNNYKKEYNADPIIYSFDLTGYGSMQFTDRVCLLSGFSERIFDLMAAFEGGGGSLVEKIEEIRF